MGLGCCRLPQILNPPANTGLTSRYIIYDLHHKSQTPRKPKTNRGPSVSSYKEKHGPSQFCLCRYAFSDWNLSLARPTYLHRRRQQAVALKRTTWQAIERERERERERYTYKYIYIYIDCESAIHSFASSSPDCITINKKYTAGKNQKKICACVRIRFTESLTYEALASTNLCVATLGTLIIRIGSWCPLYRKQVLRPHIKPQRDL